MAGPRPNFVYRCYDAAGVLLYVGCSVEPVTRVSSHRINSWWGDRLHSVRYTVFPTREKALEVERRTIFTERPVCNVKGRFLVGDAREDWTLEDYRVIKTAAVAAANGFLHTPMTARLLASIDSEVEARFGVTLLGGAA